jgi:hypothetical protein
MIPPGTKIELSHTGRDMTADCGHRIDSRYLPTDPAHPDRPKQPGIVVTVTDRPRELQEDDDEDRDERTEEERTHTMCGHCAAAAFQIRIYDGG